jgi:hypothetical protein
LLKIRFLCDDGDGNGDVYGDGDDNGYGDNNTLSMPL